MAASSLGSTSDKIDQEGEKHTKQRHLGILLFDEAEVLDFCGPFEVFSLVGARHGGILKVVTVGAKHLITARNGLKVQVDFIIGDVGLPNLDILLVPGGYGVRKEVNNPLVLGWIKSIEPSLEFILSVCTGVALLGKCGLLGGLDITTHRSAFEFVSSQCPGARLCRCRRFTDNGRILTSAGIDLSFYFVMREFGARLAQDVAGYMEYDWRPKGIESCTCEMA